MTAVKQAISELIQTCVSNKQWAKIQSTRARRQQLRWLHEHRVTQIGYQFAQRYGHKVLHGPFAGMTYPLRSILTRQIVPKLLGSYEAELTPIIEAALETKYDQVIDIGGAEGYYAVGFALRGKSPVTAYETDSTEAAHCKQMAKLNQAQLKVKSWCSPDILQRAGEGQSCFVLSDCEGYEWELFDEPTIHALWHSDVLIEIHGKTPTDTATAAHVAEMAERFKVTHNVRIIESRPRNAAEYPELLFLGAAGPAAIAEHRDAGQCWVHAVPKGVTHYD